MKAKTALLIAVIALVIVVPALFFAEPQNKEILGQSFAFLGMQFPVGRSLMMVFVLAAVLPSLYFSAKMIKIIRQNKASDRISHQNQKVHDELEQAQAFYDHGDLEAVVDALDNHNTPAAVYLRAKARAGLGEREQAKTDLRDNFLEAEHTPSGYLLAQCMEEDGENPLEVLQAIIRKEGDQARAARMKLLQAYDRMEDWEACHRLAGEITAAGEELPPEQNAAYQYENILRQASEMPVKKQIEAFQTILRHVPDFVPANLALGDAHMASGNVEKAFQVYEHAFLETRNPVFLERFEAYYLEQGRPEDAIQIYRELLVRIGGPLIKFQLGKLYFKLEMADDSLEVLEPLETTLGHIPGYLFYLAELKVRRGRYQEALDYFKKLAEAQGFRGEDYICGHCQTAYQNWQRRCTTCRHWGSITLEAGLVSVEKVPQNPIHYG